MKKVFFITINRITFSDTELAYAANADGGVEDIVNNLKGNRMNLKFKK